MNKNIERPIAALTMFTKLPLWKIFPNISGESYRHVVTWWPFAGWITGVFCGGLYLLLSLRLPSLPSAFLALGGRLLLSGGYHEDGLADFFDGFGGGTSEEKILTIMKDSHIGTYGVIALVIFIGTLVSLMSSLPTYIGAMMIICTDPWSKFCSGRMLSFLEYARKDATAKNLAAYPRPTASDTCIALCFAAIPIILTCIYLNQLVIPVICGVIVSCITTAFLLIFMKKKIGGYTGDCCGAVYLIAELAFCLFFTISYQ